MALSNALTSVVGWLRAGYPEGVPERDYLPLFALLRRQLSEDEVREVTAALADAGRSDPVSHADIGVLITKTTNEMPLEADVARVSARLAAGGWPLAQPS